MESYRCFHLFLRWIWCYFSHYPWILILSMWAGGIAADLWFQITGAGLVATPSPGSIFAYLAVTPKGGHFAVLGGVLIGAVGSAVVGTLILKARPIKETDSGVEEAIEVNVPTAE